MPQGSAAVYHRSSTAHCSNQCGSASEEYHYRIGPMQCASVPPDFHRPLPQGSAAAYHRRSTATAPGHRDSVPRESQCPLPAGNAAVYYGISNTLPLRSAAEYLKSLTACCPKAVRQCTAGVPLPTASRQCGGVLQEFHCPLPTALHQYSSVR